MAGVPLNRDDYEAEERERLSPLAALSAESRGRERPDKERDEFRTEYQRDRDRIIHCKAFRRLMHKTQVFLAPQGDHYRTRLTHTLEVAQISRSVARSLRLNEDLAEAIALGHDLGHTPFGHTGEEAITDCYEAVRDRFANVPAKFEHNIQSARVVEVLEFDGRGMNLTWEVRNGIRCHTGAERAETLEGRIVAIADRIAYVTADIEDSARGGVLDEDDLPAGAAEVLGKRYAERIHVMVQDMIRTSAETGDVRMSPRVWDAMMEMREYLDRNVYTSSRAKAEEPKALGLVRRLFEYYLENPGEMPAEYGPASADELVVKVTDYVAGMTDHYAIRTHDRLFVPGSWRE